MFPTEDSLLRPSIPIRALMALCAVSLAAQTARADHVLVIPNTAETWTIRTVAGLRINDRDRVLVNGSRFDLEKAVHPSAYRRLRSAPMSTIVAGPNGGALLLSGAPGEFELVVPDGFRLDTPASAHHLWNSSWISFQGLTSRHKREAISAPHLFAIVPAGADPADALAEFVLSPEPFFDAGPRSDGFRKRMSLLAAVTARYPNHRATLRLSEWVYGEMENRFTRLEKHGAGFTELLDALAFAEVSRRIKPADERHDRMRSTLAGYKERIDRDRASVKALGEARQSDALLASYGDLERFDDHFPEVRSARDAEFRNSAALHYEKALRAYENGQLEAARSELLTALRRSPGFDEAQALADRVHIASTVGTRRDSSGPARSASTAAALPARTAGTSTGELQIQRYLGAADRLIAKNDLGKAKQEIGKAIFLDPRAPGIPLTLARLRSAEGDLLGASKQLDDFDSRAPRGAESEQLRSDVASDLLLKRSALGREVAEAMAARRYDEALRLATGGIDKLDPDNPDYLYYAGVSSAILRHGDRARNYLRRFLDVSLSPTAERDKRLMARRILALLDRPVNQPNLPVKSWFSAWRLDDSAAYDPISGTFLPTISGIRSSNGANAVFRWSDGRLQSVASDRVVSHARTNIARSFVAGMQAYQYGFARTTIEGDDRRHDGFYFHYDAGSPQVVRVTHTMEAVESGAQQLRVQAPVTVNGLIVRQGRTSLSEPSPEVVTRDSTRGYVTLLNGPGIDPLIAEAYTGEPAAFGFAPNAYMNPFAWERIHMFALSYDDEGRVRSARDTEGGAQPLRFQWYGQRLLRIFQHVDSDPRSPLAYERTMHYAGDRLTGETIRFGGKTATIAYKYDSDYRLLEAVCSPDASTGGAGRRVTFRH